MRICVQVSTGKILEMQSDARAGTLIANAVAQGIDAKDLAEEVVTPAEYKARMAVQEPAPTPVDYSDSANMDRTLKAVLLCVAQVGNLNANQIRTMFKNKYDALG
jgi:hypothetical protein